MASMTLDERVEAACIARDGGQRWTEICDNHPWMANLAREGMRGMLHAAFPELFSSPPTHWLAPWDISGDVVDPYDWRVLRDAYLKDPS